MEATEEPQPTDTPASTEAPDVNTPALLTQYSFEFSGFSQPLTVGDTETVLHPVELDEALYVPLTEILQNSAMSLLRIPTEISRRSPSMCWLIFTRSPIL